MVTRVRRQPAGKLLCGTMESFTQPYSKLGTVLVFIITMVLVFITTIVPVLAAVKRDISRTVTHAIAPSCHGAPKKPNHAPKCV